MSCCQPAGVGGQKAQPGRCDEAREGLQHAAVLSRNTRERRSLRAAACTRGT